jgi:hypothetical protein
MAEQDKQDKQERQVVLNGKIALAMARAERAEAELANLRSRLRAEIAAADRRAAQKITMLRIIFNGIAALMCFLGVLIFINWYIPGSVDSDGMGAAYFQMSKDILLVLTGILGSAMANVFDSGRSASRSTDIPPSTDTDSAAP